MLVSIAIDPACFGPDVVTDIETRHICERLLTAATYENAVFVCDADPVFSGKLIDNALTLSETSTRLGQQIATLAADFRKNRSLSMAHISRTIEGDNISILRQIALKLRADIVVCARQQDAESLEDLREHGIEVCCLTEYLSSECEKRRVSWKEMVGLESASQDDIDQILGGAVKYCYDLKFFDRYIGPATRGRRISASLKESAKGIVYVCTLWRKVSPYSGGRKADIAIYTEGGNAGAGGFIEPDEARRLVRLAVSDEDQNEVIGRISVEVKQDSDPAVFTERLIQTGSRCWQIGHSLSSISHLKKPPGRRGTVFIGPDGRYLRKVVCEIKELKDA